MWYIKASNLYLPPNQSGNIKLISNFDADLTKLYNISVHLDSLDIIHEFEEFQYVLSIGSIAAI